MQRFFGGWAVAPLSQTFEQQETKKIKKKIKGTLPFFGLRKK